MYSLEKNLNAQSVKTIKCTFNECLGVCCKDANVTFVVIGHGEDLGAVCGCHTETGQHQARQGPVHGHAADCTLKVADKYLYIKVA